jgi:hypothetical protein
MYFFGRLYGSLAVSRSFGDAIYKRPKTSKDFVSWEPFMITETLTPSHKYLVLACDGLFDVMSQQEVAEMTHKLFLSGQDASSVAKSLVSRAIKDLNTEDNVTVIVVKIEWDDESQSKPSSAHQETSQSDQSDHSDHSAHHAHHTHPESTDAQSDSCHAKEQGKSPRTSSQETSQSDQSDHSAHSAHQETSQSDHSAHQETSQSDHSAHSAHHAHQPDDHSAHSAHSAHHAHLPETHESTDSSQHQDSHHSPRAETSPEVQDINEGKASGSVQETIHSLEQQTDQKI